MSQELARLREVARERPLQVTELVAALGPAQFDRIDRVIRTIRESFVVPYVVRDHREYHELLFAFHDHYFRLYWRVPPETRLDHPRDITWDFIKRALGSDDALTTGERNAIAGRDGGMIGVIDAFAEGLIKLHMKTYMEIVFLDLVPHHDFDLRLRLAQELLNTYGHYLFPNEELLPHWIIATNIESFIQGFVNQLAGIRRAWRR